MEYSKKSLKLTYDDYKGEGYGEDTGPSESFIYWAFDALVEVNAAGEDPASWYDEELRKNPQHREELYIAYQMFIDEYLGGDVRNLRKQRRRQQPDRTMGPPTTSGNGGESGDSGSMIWGDDTAAFIAAGVAILGIVLLAYREWQ